MTVTLTEKTLRDIYKAGRQRGLEFGEHACFNVQLGYEWQGSEDPMPYVIDDETELEQARSIEAHECESNNRCYSPFEFTAKELNDYGYRGDDGDDDRPFYAEDAWEAYDEGISKGVQIALWLESRKS